MVPIARIEPLDRTGVRCSWNRTGRVSFKQTPCHRAAAWRCIVRPIGRRTDKPARCHCTEHARVWAGRHGIQMPLAAEVHLSKPHWSEVRCD